MSMRATSDRSRPKGSLQRLASQAETLDAESEREITRKARDGDKRATERLVRSHMRLVQSVAQAYARRGLSMDDLMSEGTLGLLEAARRFDPELGNRFSTYAVWWVRQRIRRFAMSNRRIVGAPSTRNARRIRGSLQRTRNEISQRMGRPARRSEIAEALDVTPEEVAMVESSMGARDVPIGPEDDGMTRELPAMLLSPEDAALLSERRRIQHDTVQASLKGLSDRERVIIEKRLLCDDSTSLSTLGEHFGVSRERVRQIQNAAQRKLRGVLVEVA